MLYAFFNGFNNSGTLVAAPISTHALPPRGAIALAVLAEFVGPFIFGVAVAATIGRDFLEITTINMNVLLAATVAIIAWNVVTWYLAIPSSATHGLFGGLAGAAFAAGGTSAFKLEGILRILGGLLLAPLVGFLAGYLTFRLIQFLVQGASPGVNEVFRNGHFVTTVALAMSHGTNNGQQSIGLITLGLVLLGLQADFHVSVWVIVAVAAALAAGVGLGGYRIIRKLGGQIYRLRPVHGFASQASSAGVIIISALLGSPVSTSQVITTSIIGVGAAERARGVRWGVAGQIATAWLVTIPVVGLAAGLLYLLLDWLW